MNARSAASLRAAAGALFGCGGDETAAPAPPPTINEGHPPAAGEPANVVGGFTIEIPPVVLQPGEESFPCYIFPLEIEGPSRTVGGALLRTGPGMHHGNITTRPKSGEGVRECPPGEGSEEFGGEAEDILAGGAVLFGSSTQMVGEEWQSFPDGMGYIVSDAYEIVARMHYLNTTGEELTVAPSYEWFTIDEASVTHTLGPFAWVLSGWEIPPLSSLTVTGTCDTLGPMHIVNVLPHMHALGTEFFGSFVGGPYDGQRWLDSKGYDPENGVMTQYTPAIPVLPDYSVQFGCTWMNTFDKPIVEGTGDNEMCILFGYAYPYENAFSAFATDAACVMAAPPPPGSN